MPTSQKDALLVRLIAGDLHVGADLRRDLDRRPGPDHPGPGGARRTVAELLAGADEHRAQWERVAAEQHARQRAAQAQAATRARDSHLDALAREGEDAWRRVEALIRPAKPRGYDQAVTLLTDLRDLATRTGSDQDFAHRLSQIRATYPNRPSLLQRLDLRTDRRTARQG